MMNAVVDVVAGTRYAIRPMQVADIDAVMAVERRAFATPWQAAGYQHELTQNDVAFYQILLDMTPPVSRLVGYAGYWLLAGEAHISTIAVDPPWRRRGLGDALLISQLQRATAQGAFMATLEVREHNIVAQRLYEKYQFEHVGRRKRYYKDTGEDALIMTVAALDEAYRQFLIGQATVAQQRLAQPTT
jgi:ribosomal-protein-alanine N-acetyltransferase